MITQEKFKAFQAVQESGLTNMFALQKVVNLAEELANVELDKTEVIDIISNYDEYARINEGTN